MNDLLISKKNSFLHIQTEEEIWAKSLITGRTRRANSEDLGMIRFFPEVEDERNSIQIKGASKFESLASASSVTNSGLDTPDCSTCSSPTHTWPSTPESKNHDRVVLLLSPLSYMDIEEQKQTPCSEDCAEITLFHQRRTSLDMKPRNDQRRISLDVAPLVNQASSQSSLVKPSGFPSTAQSHVCLKVNSVVPPFNEDAQRVQHCKCGSPSTKVVLNLDSGLLPLQEPPVALAKWEPAMEGTYMKNEILETDSVNECERSTVMMKNIPNKYTQETIMELIHNKGFKMTYDFLYLPIDFRSKSNMGYAFINFIQPKDARRFISSFTGFHKWHFNSAKVCEITWSRPYQGLAAHVDRYRNSPSMHPSVPQEFQPAIFFAGQRLPFPPPTQLIASPKRKYLVQES